MAFPTVESITETGFATATTAHLVDFPATVNAGDLMILIAASDNATIQTTPAGWTLLDKRTPNNQVYGGVYALDAAGTEDGGTIDVVTAAAEEMSAHMYRITGWKGSIATDVDISTFVEEATGTDAPNPASVTAGGGSDDNLWIVAVCSGDDDESVQTYSTNYGNGVSVSSGSVTASAQPRSHSCRRELTAASDDADAWLLTGAEQWLAWTIVVAPAAAADNQMMNKMMYEGHLNG